MRRNKKLLLGAISAMSLVALGTGAVSTFAWYNATGANVTAVSSGATLTTATITALNSQVNVSVSAPDSDAAKLLLSTPVHVDAGTYNCELDAGDCPYYNGTVDAAHMLKFTPDADHLAAINVQITVSAKDGANPIADGTYYLHASLASPARLGLEADLAGSGYAKYVGNVNKTLTIAFTVADGVVSANASGFAVLSITGTTPTSAVAESTVSFLHSDWTFTVDQTNGTAAAGSKIITSRV